MNNRNIPVSKEDDPLFNEAEDEIALRAHLAHSAEDVRHGRVCDADKAFDEVISVLEHWAPAINKTASGMKTRV